MPMSFPAAVVPAYAWYDRPSPYSVPTSTLIRVGDIGSTPAGAMLANDGNVWAPVNGSMVLFNQASSIVGAANTSEQVLNLAGFAGGLLSKNGDVVRVTLSWVKSGQDVTLTSRLRLGTTGTVSDPLLIQTATTGKVFSAMFAFRRVSPISIQLLGNPNFNGSFSGNTNDASPGPVTVSSMDSPLRLSVTGQLGATTETLSLQSFLVELVKA